MKARLAEIVAGLKQFDEVTDFTQEQVTEINSMNTEFSDLKSKIEAKETIAAMTSAAGVSQRQVKPAPIAPAAPVAAPKHEKTGGFDTYGNFATAVYNKSQGKTDDRFQNATIFEHVAEDGGILVPEGFMSEIQTKFEAQDSLLEKTFQLPVTGNSLGMPIDEEQPWNSGVVSYWTAEGKPITSSKGKLSQANYRVEKLAALVKVTDEMLEDSAVIEALLRKKAPASMVSKVNNAIIDGDGAGKPLGFLRSGFKYQVAKEGGQAVDTIVFGNIVNMESRLLPGSNAVWIANPAVKQQLRRLKDDNGNLIYTSGVEFANVSGAGFETLMGKPILYMPGATKALGDEGDLSLVDLSYYYTLVKGGIKSSMSTHLYFDRDETAFKFTMRLDGHCPFKAPVKTENGDYDMSAIITLEAR